MINTILLCTVGGSPQPILKAIASTRPDFICFFCTGKDPETGNAGSEKQVAGLFEGKFKVCIVPADDLDGAYSKIHSALADIRSHYPDARLIADYTGGTKTMTAALVMAALDSDDINLQLVTGPRANLLSVPDGSEYPVAANVERIRLEKAMRPFLNAWSRYAYDEAEAGLSALASPSNTSLRAHLSLARNLSRAFAAWDRFDHKTALEVLRQYRPRIGESMGLHLKALEMLTEESRDRREPLQIHDLWLNAQRREAQGRYDDAVARVYRLLEWTAQWQLQLRAGVDTADIPADKIPPGITPTQNRHGIYQVGLMQAWDWLGHIPNTPAAAFYQAHGKELQNHLLLRNQSILAHGFTPIHADQWRAISAWLTENFLPMLKQCIRVDGGIRFDLDRLQLPIHLPLVTRE